MEGGDPWDWGVDRLIQELCTHERSWIPPRDANKLPDASKLAEAIQEHELDGETLLTYEDERGCDAFDSLCKDLGVKKIPQKLVLHDATKQFQQRSRRYREWKQHRNTDDSPDKDAPIEEVSGAGASITPGNPPNGTSVANGLGCDGKEIASASCAEGYDGSSVEPAPKRRRLAPTNISATPSQLHLGVIPTEADSFLRKWTDDNSNEKPQAMTNKKTRRLAPALVTTAPPKPDQIGVSG